GFLAKDNGDEIPIIGATCKITHSYEDISEQVLNSAKGITDFAERAKEIEIFINELKAKVEAEDPSITAEISEMFEGKTYILFKYKTIKDVRIVYAPPRSIGEFGGETDNWVWPRHTGDFSFMRAYVAPDGSSAEYSKDNVPYTPQKYLKVNSNGVNEGDFLFILGYPGRTFRNKPSQYLVYQKEYMLPYISKWYEWQINEMEKLSENDEAKTIKFAGRIKSLANTMKNYKGKLIGLNRLNLVESNIEEENELGKFIGSDAKLKAEYGSLLNELNGAYKTYMANAKEDLWFGQIYRSSYYVRLADGLINYGEQLKLPDAERRSAYNEKNLPKFEKTVKALYAATDLELEAAVLKKMIKDALVFNEESKIAAVDNLIKQNDGESIDQLVDEMFAASKLLDEEFFHKNLGKPLNELKDLNDPLIDFAIELKKQTDAEDHAKKELEGKIDVLSAQYIDVKRLWKNEDFIPDANSTLRLTYGYVKGYSPADAVYYAPFTTLQGVVEKSYQGGDFKAPEKLLKLYEKKDFGKYYSQKLSGVPVAFLYNMDTTGGNSGSPILNAYGEIVGVNFDRTFDATINDYAWSEDYSRSIGVDIRYVLFVLDKYAGADYLVKELGAGIPD
ncbi:MAG TPA: S46 family peptidase, partial [Ignavibacteriales bacterium]|nr:S46 family peptidase [Ignavibacteriales bacterium]